MESWKDDLGFIAIHKSVGSHFTLKKPAVLQVHPGGVVPPWTDAEKAVHTKRLGLVQEIAIEALKVGELVPVCTAMWKMAELTGYWGYYGIDEVVLDTESVFHRFADILSYMVVGGESKPKARSAMARARKLSKNLQTAAIMKHVRNSIKGPEYRQYKTHAEERLSEFTRIIDLDSDGNAVREAAFGAVLRMPTLILQAQHAASVFAQQLDEDMVMSEYLALVQHYLLEAKPLEKATILLLDHKLDLPLARCRHETTLVDSAEVAKQMILFDMEEKVQQGQAMSSVGKAEDEDVAGNGRGLTKGEMSELTLVRSQHWAVGDFCVTACSGQGNELWPTGHRAAAARFGAAYCQEELHVHGDVGFTCTMGLLAQPQDGQESRVQQAAEIHGQGAHEGPDRCGAGHPPELAGSSVANRATGAWSILRDQL